MVTRVVVGCSRELRGKGGLSFVVVRVKCVVVIVAAFVVMKAPSVDDHHGTFWNSVTVNGVICGVQN